MSEDISELLELDQILEEPSWQAAAAAEDMGSQQQLQQQQQQHYPRIQACRSFVDERYECVPDNMKSSSQQSIHLRHHHDHAPYDAAASYYPNDCDNAALLFQLNERNRNDDPHHSNHALPPTTMYHSTVQKNPSGSEDNDTTLLHHHDNNNHHHERKLSSSFQTPMRLDPYLYQHHYQHFSGNNHSNNYYPSGIPHSLTDNPKPAMQPGYKSLENQHNALLLPHHHHQASQRRHSDPVRFPAILPKATKTTRQRQGRPEKKNDCETAANTNPLAKAQCEPNRCSSSSSAEGTPRLPVLRPLSAYNYFFRDERSRIIVADDDKDDTISNDLAQQSQQQRDWNDDALLHKLVHEHCRRERGKKRIHRRSHGKISFCELSKLISKRWKALCAEGKEFYERVAAADLKRYREDMKVAAAQAASHEAL